MPFTRWLRTQITICVFTLIVPCLAHAQETPVDQQFGETFAQPEPPVRRPTRVQSRQRPHITTQTPTAKNEGRISLEAGVDFPTDYYFRSIIQETDDFIAQPYANASMSLYQDGQGFNSLSVTLGLWNSFHAGPTGASGTTTVDPSSWYEADLFGGVTLGFFDLVELGMIYTAYTSPNDSFGTVHELAWNLSVDDRGLLGAFALSPHILLAVEVDGQADGGGAQGVYLELGIEPGFTLGKNSAYPLSVAFPLTLGLSLSDYYEHPVTGNDETFGYFAAGIVLALPLAFIPESFGAWGVSVAGHFLILGDSTQALNNGDDFKPLATVGISLAY